MKNDGLSRVLKVGKTQELVHEMKIEQAMQRNVHTVRPDDSMEDVMRALKQHRISGTPVVDGGTLIGIVSIENLIESLLAGKTMGQVKETMSRNVVTMYSDEPLVHAIRGYHRYSYGRFPVLDRKSKKLVGIITKGDIVRCLLKRLESNHHDEEMCRYTGGHLFEDVVSDKSVLVLRYYVDGSTIDKAGEQSSRLKKTLLRLGIHPDITRRIAIASYEAEMNMVIFARGGEIVASIEPERITINAIDHGPGIPDVALAMKPGYSTAPDWVRELGFGAGMGLPNMKKCSDEMNVESTIGEGTNVQFSLITK